MNGSLIPRLIHSSGRIPQCVEPILECVEVSWFGVRKLFSYMQYLSTLAMYMYQGIYGVHIIMS